MALIKKGAGRRAAELFAASVQKNNSKSNVVLKVMRGEYSLTVTFWICCISIPLAAHLVFSRLVFPILNPHTWYGSSIFILWAALSLLYGAVACLGLWRSRRNFAGKKLWADLAGLFALAGAVFTVAYAAMILISWHMMLNL